MSFAFLEGMRLAYEAGLDWRETGADVRAILVMSNNTIHLAGGVDGGQVVVANIAVLDECDGANYARKVLAGQALSFSSGLQLDATTPVVYTALGAGSRANVAWIIYKHVTNDTDSPLLFYLNSGSFPFNGTGIDIPVAFPSGLAILIPGVP